MHGAVLLLISSPLLLGLWTKIPCSLFSLWPNGQLTWASTKESSIHPSLTVKKSITLKTYNPKFPEGSSCVFFIPVAFQNTSTNSYCPWTLFHSTEQNRAFAIKNQSGYHLYSKLLNFYLCFSLYTLIKSYWKRSL